MDERYHPADQTPSEKFMQRVHDRAIRASKPDPRIDVRLPERHEGIVDRRNYNAAIEAVNMALAHLAKGKTIHAKGALAAAKEHLGKQFTEAPNPVEF